jgi:hypothetical protein
MIWRFKLPICYNLDTPLGVDVYFNKKLVTCVACDQFDPCPHCVIYRRLQNKYTRIPIPKSVLTFIFKALYSLLEPETMSNLTSGVVDEAKAKVHIVSGHVGSASSAASIARVDYKKMYVQHRSSNEDFIYKKKFW